MLGLSVDIKVDIKETHYPITFEGVNVCVHCGSKDSLKIVDTFGNIVKQEVHAFNHIKCKNCGAKYSIRWDKNSNGGFSPIAVDPSIKKQFTNFITDKILDRTYDTSIYK